MNQGLTDVLRKVCAVLVLVLLPVLAMAQTEAAPTPDLAAIEQLLKSAEAALESEATPTAELQRQRDKIAEQRLALSTLAEGNSVEARALQAQLDALGPLPGNGATEAQTTADKRAQLLDALATANAPKVGAQDALTRSEVILNEIDRRIRTREAQESLLRFPSPLWPTTWWTAAKDLTDLRHQIGQDLAARFEKPGARDRFLGMLPTAGLLAAFALLALIWVQPRLSRHLIAAAATARTAVRRMVLQIAANLTLLILQAIAAVLLIVLLPLLDLVPSGFTDLPFTLVFAATFLIFANWLAMTLFAVTEATRVTSDTAAQAEEEDHVIPRLIRLLGLVMVLELLTEYLGQNGRVLQATVAVVSLPVVAFSSFLLWQLADVVLAYRKRSTSEEGHSADAGLTRFLARSMQVAAVLSLALAVLGYINLARTVMLPIIMTLALLGLSAFVYRSVLRIISMARARDEDNESYEGSLLPFAIIIVLALALSPALALIWGAKISDLQNVWRLLTEGVVVGDTRLSLNGVLVLVAVFAIGALATGWVQRVLRLTVLPRTRLDGGAQSAVAKGVGYLGVTISALAAVSSAGLNLSNLAVVVGALSVGIGLGLQNIVSNFVSGIILLIERPIKEGDWIEVSGKTGIVRKIAVRSTRIETFDRHDVIVPNLDLISGTVTNFTLSTPTGRLMQPVGIAYGSDVNLAREILENVMRAHPSVLDHPSPAVLFSGLGDSALDFLMICFVDNETRIPVIRSDLLFAVYSGLQGAGIEIPFPQRDLRLRDVDAIVKAFKAAGSGTPEVG